MTAALVLVVFVSASEAHDPSTAAMTKAAQIALGPGSSVVVRELPRTITDDEAIDAGRTLHATAVAELTWSDPQHLRASMHVHVEGAARWIDRELGFVVADAPAERGRAIGFTLASMLPERPTPEDAPPIVPPPPATSATTMDLAPPPAPTVESGTSAEPPRLWRGAVEAAAAGSVGIGGYGGGIGAALGMRYHLGSGFALRFGGGARSGEVPPAQASSLFVFGAVGLGWSTTPRPSLPFGFGARTDLLLTRLQLSHLSADDPSPVRESRWLMGADALVEAAWFFSQSAGIFMAMGTEFSFGTTDVVVAGNQVAVVPLVRGVTELGLRARF